MNLGMQGFPVSHLLWSSKEEAVSELRKTLFHEKIPTNKEVITKKVTRF